MPLAHITVQFFKIMLYILHLQGDTLVLRTSSVCKIVSHLPVAQVRVSPSNPDNPRREGSSPKHADFLGVVSTGSDNPKRHFVHCFVGSDIFILVVRWYGNLCRVGTMG